MELLFESRANVLDAERRLNFVQIKPVVHPEPVLLPDTFADGSLVSIYGTVLRDGGRMRMWYMASPEDYDWRADTACVAYAESEDGIHWVKPKLNFVEHGPGPNNLLNMFFSCATVFIDPDSSPSHRYRATGCGYPGWFMAHPSITETGYYTGHSADGLSWQLDSTKPRWHGMDEIFSVYHPQRRCGLIAMKYSPYVGRMMRRSYHMAEFRDGEYTGSVPALYPDDFDDVCAMARGYHSCDYYSLTMMPAGMGTVGFLLKLWHKLPYAYWAHAGMFGTADVALVYQPVPGARWLHVPGRPNFIESNGLPWLEGWVSCASSPVEMGDEHWLYLSGHNFSHCFFHNQRWGTVDRWIEWTKKHKKSGIGFARWPKWRLFGFESDPDASFVLDLGPVDRPSELVLNYKTRPGGSLRVALAEGPRQHYAGWGKQTAITGRALEDAVALEGDSIGKPVAWKDGTTIAPSGGKHVFARIELEVAGVYAYEVRAKT